MKAQHEPNQQLSMLRVQRDSSCVRLFAFPVVRVFRGPRPPFRTAPTRSWGHGKWRTFAQTSPKHPKLKNLPEKTRAQIGRPVKNKNAHLRGAIAATDKNEITKIKLVLETQYEGCTASLDSRLLSIIQGMWPSSRTGKSWIPWRLSVLVVLRAENSGLEFIVWGQKTYGRLIRTRSLALREGCTLQKEDSI